MIEVTHYKNKSYEATFVPTIERAYADVRKLRPDLPEDIKISFTDKGIVAGLATGGYAFSADTIHIAIDSNQTDTLKVRQDLTATVFHEAFHLSMGYTGQAGPFRLLECTVQEGAATVFAMQYAGSRASELYGDFASESKKRLEEWLRFATNPSNQALAREAYKHFAFFDPIDTKKWKLYKVGTWIVTEYCKERSLDIKYFKALDVEQIIQNV